MKRRDVLKGFGAVGAGCLLGTQDGSNARGAAPPADAVASTQAEISTYDIFEQYECRFAQARMDMPRRNPAIAAERRAIIDAAKRCLGIRDEWIPQIHADVQRETAFEGGRIERLRSTSWPGVVGTALLYWPQQAPSGRLPLVILCCGHGAGGKLAGGYQRMARHITRLGAMVLCPDNLGQGERTPMGHTDCVKPFACGMSVQGLIVMETLGWVAWARKHPQVDPSRVAAIGNSGGGTLTVFLAGLCPDLAVLSSSGYPSTFDFVARKEKKHCHCNILPGIVGELEMWHLLGGFAPRAMFVFQGAGDALIPSDLFHHMARKVRGVYRRLGAEQAFQARVLKGEHSWDEGRELALGEFLAKRLGLKGRPLRSDGSETLLADGCLKRWPAEAITTDALAEQLSGRKIDDGIRLWDVFPPNVPAGFSLQDISQRGSTRQILAQFEAFLKPSLRRPRSS